MPLTRKQIKRLLTPVRADRVETVRGNTYLPQFEARAELSRVFGFGSWDSTIHSVALVYEEPDEREGKDGKTVFYWRVCYRAACTLRIRDYWGEQVCEHTEFHVEECAPQPNRGEAHALALTSVESYALRRACINLGDSLGLHLYRDGSLAPLIRGTLQTTDPESPLYSEEKIAAPQPPMSADQMESLKNSLGATVVGEESTTGLERDGDEMRPETARA